MLFHFTYFHQKFKIQVLLKKNSFQLLIFIKLYTNNLFFSFIMATF